MGGRYVERNWCSSVSLYSENEPLFPSFNGLSVRKTQTKATKQMSNLFLSSPRPSVTLRLHSPTQVTKTALLFSSIESSISPRDPYKKVAPL
uniref:Uncharacterized protein n=2 Tax=Brassica campestris TaxID=3711 RepID=A0A3P6AW40_BRACM|nr:unnamed protein product [Brassica rapa]